MADEKPFIPEFGPNGAVMNSPTMTDAMRKKIVEGADDAPQRREPTGWRIFRAVTALAFFATFFSTVKGDDAVGEFGWLMPWVASLCIVMCVLVALHACWLVLMRWELVGRYSGPSARRLRLPRIMRVGFVVCEIGVVAAFAAMPVAFVALSTWAPDAGRWTGGAMGGSLALLAVALGLAGALRTLANRRDWVWQEQDQETGLSSPS